LALRREIPLLVVNRRGRRPGFVSSAPARPPPIRRPRCRTNYAQGPSRPPTSTSRSRALQRATTTAI